MVTHLLHIAVHSVHITCIYGMVLGALPSLYLRDSHRVLKLKLCHLDSASEWPKLIMPLAGGQTLERLWPLAILIFGQLVQKTYSISGCLAQ